MRPVLLLALVCQVMFAWLYLVATPAFEGPDESDHYGYAFHLSHAQELPVFRRTSEDLGRTRFDEATLAHHPPLYYALLAATMHATGQADTTSSLRRNPDFNLPDAASSHLFWLHGPDEVPPVSDAIGLLWGLRSWSIFFGLVTVLLTHRLARLAVPDRPAVADTAALLLACLPMWSFMGGVLDNGNLATALAHGALLALALGLTRRRLSLGLGATVGLLVGLALMAKLTSIFLLPLMLGVWGWAWWRWPERPRSVLSGVVALALVAALTGWFFARNLSLYGGPLALAAHAEAFAGIAVADGQRMTWLLSGFLPDVFTSLLGWFGWWILPPAEPLVAVGGVVVAVAAVGWVLGLRGRRPASAGRAVTVLLVVACVLVFGTVLRFNMQFHQTQGRYLFGAIGPLAVLVALGLHNALGGLSALRPLAVALPPMLAAVVLFGHFRPAFDSTLTPVPDHYAAMVPGLTEVSAPTTLQLLSPADGATLSEAPEFRWRPDEGAAERLYTLHAWTGDGRIYLATFEWGHIELGGDRWALPAPVWDLLPSGTDFFWRVRVVPDRKAGETVADAASSPAFRFVKQGP